MVYVTDRRAILGGYSLSGSDGNGQPVTNKPIFVTYSFQTSIAGLSIDGSGKAFADSFKAFTENQKTLARGAFGEWDKWSGITFLEVPSGQGDIKLATFNFDLGGPYDSSQAAAYGGGGIVFVSERWEGSSQLFLHEIGHNLGFKHSFQGDFTLAPADDDYAHTVMSYTSNGTSGATLGTLDKDAVAYLYGEPGSDGTQVASWNWDAAAYRLTQIGRDTAETIIGVGTADIIEGRGGDDRIEGRDGNDTLSGNEGNDTLFGGAGNDVLDGGAGDDILWGDDGVNKLYGGDGADTLLLTVGADVTGIVLDGGAGRDSANITLVGTANLSFSALPLVGVESIYVTAGSGADRLTNDSAIASVSFAGGDGNDILRGGSGSGSINGGAGDDILYAGSGFSFLYGGSGTDRFIFETAASSTSAAMDQIEDFQSGIDRIDLTGFRPTNVTLQSAGASFYINATSAAGQFVLFVRQAVALNDISYNVITGTAAAETLNGSEGWDTILGLDGNDTLRGLAGSDTLTGGGGADSFVGTRAELNGDTITDLALGDRIVVGDAAYADFSYARSAQGIVTGGAAISLPGTVNTRLVVHAAAEGGTELALANRYTNLNDFNGDGHSDLLWQNANGSISTWNVSGNVVGNQLAQNSYFASVPASWNVVETFDMGGDGRSDILWRHENGAVSVWTASGSGFATGTYNAQVGSEWKIAGTGDLNGDGKDDLLWRRDDGAISSWQSTGTSFQQNAYAHASVGASWKVAGLADFDGDGKDDLLWRNDNGALSEWQATGAGFAESVYNDTVGTEWKIVGLGDFNGDGRDDILWRNASGAISEWQSTGAGFARNTYFDSSVGNSWQVAQIGDFNDDGRADILWHNTGGAISIWQSNGQAFDQNVLYNPGADPSWQIQAHEVLL